MEHTEIIRVEELVGVHYIGLLSLNSVRDWAGNFELWQIEIEIVSIFLFT